VVWKAGWSKLPAWLSMVIVYQGEVSMFVIFQEVGLQNIGLFLCLACIRPHTLALIVFLKFVEAWFDYCTKCVRVVEYLFYSPCIKSCGAH